MMDRMQRTLELSPEQHETISEIFADSRERTRELWKQMREPMNAEIKRVHEEVKKILTPDQAAKFDEMRKRQHEQFKNRKGEHGPKPDSPQPPPGQHCAVPSTLVHQCAL